MTVRHRNHGKWIVALSDLEFGVNYLRDHCTSIGWECSLALRSIVGCIDALGELRTLDHQTQQFQQQAQESGDVLMGLLVATSSSLGLIAADNTQEARARVRNALAYWPRSGFHIQHLHALKIEVLCDLYEGRPEGAWNRVVEAWPEIERSNFLRLPSRRIEALLLRTRAALAAAAKHPDDYELADVVEQDITQLERERYPYVTGFALLLRAGLLTLRGNSEDVIEYIEAAVTAFQSSGMLLMAACARWCRGLWIGGKGGARSIQKAEAFMTMQTIVSPTTWVRVFAPALVGDDEAD